ncbi:MAG: SEC-C metal-binding domain-containing protein, partial [Candidatus Hydrogenedentota bacterium]
AIVDEVDSILVDEARTPLIISGRPEKSTDLYVKVDEAIRKLRKGKHFEAEEKGHHIIMTEEGMSTIERLMGVEDLYADDRLGIVHMVEQSLKAHNFYKRDDEYVVREGEVLIVDEFTGRLMEGRRYSDGLHQSIEAKERVAIQFESQTVATVTYQNFFKMYTKLAGMTGTAVTEASEFAEIYNLDVVQIPTNLPMQREDRTDLVFATELGKFKYVVNEIVEIHKTGRPALVGTVSIEKSELVAKLLKELGITEFEVLNAKHHEREAAIVANAGKRDAITIATNMAGRGTDIKLGEGVAELGGLAIIGTERHDSRRIDNQLRGRCGRQGDLGSTRFYVSLEDEVARLFGGNRVKRIIDMLGGEQLDEQPLDQRMVTRSIQRAQRNVEEYNFEIRKHLLKYDDVMNKQRQVIYGLRQDVLEDRDVTAQLHEMIEDIAADAVSSYAAGKDDPEQWDLEGLDTRMRAVFGYSPDLGPDTQGEGTLEESIVRQVLEEYAKREAFISDEIRDQFRAQIGGDESNVNFKKIARKRVHDYEMMALLQAVDDKWIQHLYDMDYLRESVRLRAYGQKDPLIEYKTEGFEMFEAMMMNISETVLRTLFRVTDPEFRKARHLQARQATASTENDPFDQLAHYSYVGAEKEADRSFTSYDTSRFALAGQPAAPQAVAAGAGNVAPASPSAPRAKPRPIKRVGEKTGPNDPCTCGSGKKYKKCCGAAQN